MKKLKIIQILCNHIYPAFLIPISNIPLILSFSLFRRPQVLITMKFNASWEDIKAHEISITTSPSTTQILPNVEKRH